MKQNLRFIRKTALSLQGWVDAFEIVLRIFAAIGFVLVVRKTMTNPSHVVLYVCLAALFMNLLGILDLALQGVSTRLWSMTILAGGLFIFGLTL